jgi:TetR/AcrR family transcriptional regulator, transcriptional repressor for nem operon
LLCARQNRVHSFYTMPKVKLFDVPAALAQAKNVFWQKGFNGTSMQDLVDGMQISRQSLYDTFGNKEELFVNCLQAYKQEAQNNTCTNLTYSGNLKQTIEQFFNNTITDILNDKQQKGCFMLNTLVEVVPENKKAKLEVTKNLQNLEQAFLTLFTAAKNNNNYPTSLSPQELCNHFVCTLHGLRLLGKIKKDAAALNGMVKAAVLVFNN